MTIATAATQTIQSDQAHAAQLYGTPLFFYSLPKLRAHIGRLRGALEGYPVQLLFATMANDRSDVLRAIAEEGVGACVNSVPHLQRAFEHGFNAGKIQFTSCGLPVDDMTYLQALGIPANLDSPSQIEAWCRLKPEALAGARINAASLDGSTAPQDRIGMDIPSFIQAREIAKSLGGRVNGVHLYAGTNFQAAEDILPILRSLFKLIREYPDLDYANLGGGIGVDYAHSGKPFDYEMFGAEVCALALQVAEERGRPLTLFFEPGRSTVASCGQFITRVTDIKMLYGSRYVVVDASVALFPRPFHHPGSQHRAYVLDGASDEETVKSIVVGRTTFSRDILGTYDFPASLQVGALLGFDDAGAYCESMTSRFLGQRDAVCYVEEE